MAWASVRLRLNPSLLWHVIVSPKPGTIPPTVEGLRVLRKLAREAAKAHGVVGGGTVVHHSMRGHPDEWRPHVHIIGYVVGRWEPGPIKKGPLAGHTIKFLPIGGADELYHCGLDPEREIARRFWNNVRGLLAYELGHCVRSKEGWHALTWWGELSYNKLSDPTDEALDELEAMTGLELRRRALDVCPVPGCGRSLYDVPEVYGTRASLSEDYGVAVFADDYGGPGPPQDTDPSPAGGGDF